MPTSEDTWSVLFVIPILIKSQVGVMDIKVVVTGVAANSVFSGFSQVESFVDPPQTLVVFVDICHFSHEKVPHSIVITVQFFSVSHELMAWAPGRVFKAPALILHMEFSFVSGEVQDISQGFAFMRHVVMRHMLQEHIDVTKISDRRVDNSVSALCWTAWWAQHPKKSLAGALSV